MHARESAFVLECMRASTYIHTHIHVPIAFSSYMLSCKQALTCSINKNDSLLRLNDFNCNIEF